MKKKFWSICIICVTLAIALVAISAVVLAQETELSDSAAESIPDGAEAAGQLSPDTGLSAEQEFVIPAFDALAAETEDGIEVIDSELLSEIRETMEGEKPFLTLEDVSLLQERASALYEQGETIVLSHHLVDGTAVIDPEDEEFNQTKGMHAILFQYLTELTPAEYRFQAIDFTKAGWDLCYNFIIYDFMQFIPLAGDYDSPEEAFQQIVTGECAYLVLDRLCLSSYYIYDGEPDSETFFESIGVTLSLPE